MWKRRKQNRKNNKKFIWCNLVFSIYMREGDISYTSMGYLLTSSSPPTTGDAAAISSKLGEMPSSSSAGPLSCTLHSEHPHQLCRALNIAWESDMTFYLHHHQKDRGKHPHRLRTLRCGRRPDSEVPTHRSIFHSHSIDSLAHIHDWQKRPCRRHPHARDNFYVRAFVHISMVDKKGSTVTFFFDMRRFFIKPCSWTGSHV